MKLGKVFLKLSIQWESEVLSAGTEWPGREADHSPPSSAEVRNAWSYTFTSPPPWLCGVSLTYTGAID